MAVGSQQYMANVTKYLLEHTSHQGVPVTEVIVFKLKEPASDTIMAEFESRIFANSKIGKGATRSAWGRSLTDAMVIVWMIDWVKIEDHWDFWQTDAFPPLMAAITDLCVGGNPLVKHYKFEPKGFLVTEFVQVLVWEEIDKKDDTVLMKGVGDRGSVQKKGAYAIDAGGESWFCVLLGYNSESEALANKAEAMNGGESHVVKLDYFVQSEELSENS